MSDPRDEDDDERTVVVDGRLAADPGEAAEPDDGTVVVDRPAPEPEEGTVVIDRPAPDADPDDGTVVVDRPAPEPDDGTVVVERPAPDAEDGTVVVERPAPDAAAATPEPAGGTTGGPSALVRRVPSGRRARRTAITLPPAGTVTERRAIDAVGPNAVESYVPRELPAPPPAPAAVPGGVEATRAPAPAMPSVRRRGRILGRRVVLLVGGAIVVSIAGLVLIILFVVSGG
jgi:hypothetical protein